MSMTLHKEVPGALHTRKATPQLDVHMKASLHYIVISSLENPHLSSILGLPGG